LAGAVEVHVVVAHVRKAGAQVIEC
jgi:hypothetical protein